MRAVAWAIPAAFERIEMHRAADMRTGRRHLVNFSVVVAVGRDLWYALADQPALSRPERILGRMQRAAQMLGKTFDRRGIFRQECPGGLHADTRWIVELLPRVLAALQQVRQQDAGRGAIGDALAGIAGHEEDVIVVGIAADIAREI